MNPNVIPPQVAQGIMGKASQKQGDRGLMQQLNLTRSQKQQLQAIQQQYREPLHEQRQKLAQAQQELSDLMAGTASQSQIREKYRQVEALRQQVGELNLDSMLAMREVMTLEQRSQFAQLMQKRKDNLRDRPLDGAESNRPLDSAEVNRSLDGSVSEARRSLSHRDRSDAQPE
ncbi:MAG TPA: Spy/CpxP family protein refolding chaperone [Chroococcales cyanobacterium]